MRHAAALAALLCGLAAASAAQAACPARLSVHHGDTLSTIARACGVNVETLRRANPGLNSDTPDAGMVIVVPSPPLPSPRGEIGRRSVHVMPPLVPPATGGPSIGGVPSTVILPPVPPPVPPQLILPGFGDQPGQFPLPPGHPAQWPPQRF